MSNSALKHQIANTLSSHGKIKGMTQTELAEHIGLGVRCISRALGEMGTISRSGRGVSGDPFRYQYVPAPVFCDEPALNKPKTESMGFREFSIKMLLMGAGAIWWVERVIDALEWIF